MIAIGCDHAAYSLKLEIMQYLDENKIAYIDLGTHNENSVGYPIIEKKVAEKVASGECEKGIIMCGTGVGISLAANKVKRIRAVNCSELYTAKLSREHNDTNVLSLGARVVGVEFAKMIVDTWLKTEFEGRGDMQRELQ